VARAEIADVLEHHPDDLLAFVAAIRACIT